MRLAPEYWRDTANLLSASQLASLIKALERRIFEGRRLAEGTPSLV
jgi:hypothetical protein